MTFNVSPLEERSLNYTFLKQQGGGLGQMSRAQGWAQVLVDRGSWSWVAVGTAQGSLRLRLRADRCGGLLCRVHQLIALEPQLNLAVGLHF